MLTAGIILALTYIGIIFTRLPRTNFDRPAATLTGALLMVALGVLPFDQAIESINFETITLLLGMMLLLAALQQADFFNMVAARIISIAGKPLHLLILVVCVTGAGSAFLVNDVMVLILTPIVIHACRLLRINAVPYLLAEAMASNIGSTATMVGNPQNMLIGITSGISFVDFIKYLSPVALASGVILIAVLYLFYRKEMRQEFSAEKMPVQSFSVVAGRPTAADNRRLLWSLAPILLLTIIAMFLSSFLHLSIPVIALAGGMAAVLLSGIRPSHLVQGVDWPLLLFFSGLFIVIGGAQHSGLLDAAMVYINLQPDAGGVFSIHLASAVLSQVVSNVPLTMLLIPLVRQVPGNLLWIALAAGTTLGGNATIIGAVANIIVIEGAYRQGVRIGWWEFSRVGLVVTVLTASASIGIIILQQNLGILK